MKAALAVRKRLRSHDLARVVYGAIIGLAVVVAFEAHPPAAVAVAASLVGTALAVSLAELYSDILGAEVRTRRRVERAEVARIARDARAVAFGVTFPAVFFLLAAVGVFELDTAFSLAKWSGLCLIGVYAFAAARLAGSSFPKALLYATGMSALGAVLIALKAIVH